MDLKKIKKITLIEITVILVAILASGIYFSPKLLNKKEAIAAAKIKADNAIFVSKALEEFASNKEAKPSEVAQKVAEEINQVAKNPYNKKTPAYSFDSTCSACSRVEVDDDLTMIILTSYNKKGELVARTIIKPPSFITYTKEK